MTKVELFNIILREIVIIQQIKNRVLRIAINGIEGSGKTTFAKLLTEFLQSNNVNAIHITIDGFHNPPAIRYRQGRDNGQGYYDDAYNETEFVEKVLRSSQALPPNITMRIYDIEKDSTSLEPIINIDTNAVIITDGAYLFKEIYNQYWDCRIYLKTDFDTAMSRGIIRDEKVLGGFEQARYKYIHRYHYASKLYIEKYDPEKLADISIDNSDFEYPIILKM